jgi:hypothetical protein
VLQHTARNVHRPGIFRQLGQDRVNLLWSTRQIAAEAAEQRLE